MYNQSHFSNIDMGLLATLRTAIKAMRHRVCKISELSMENKYMLQFIQSQIEEDGSQDQMDEEVEN